MAFLRKKTSEGSVGLIYSIIQKCIRRGIEEEALYYSSILYNEATKNSLRKRLVYITNEDICHLELANEIMLCSDEDLFKYVVICCRLKKTHDSAWLSRLALHYNMNDLETKDKELLDAIYITKLVKEEDFKTIRNYIGKKYSKLYSFTGKNNLVWSSYILWKYRPELNQAYTKDIIIPLSRKFNEIPFWVYDKHVSGGNKGYQFFFDNSLIVNDNIYNDKGDKFSEECKKVYLLDEKKYCNGKTKKIYEEWKKKMDIFNIQGYKDIVQVQLITGKSKPKVYFATQVENNKKYVLKGPINDIMNEQVNETERIKKLLNINHLNTHVKIINNCKWIISDCIIDYNFNEKEIKNSKLESNVSIYNGIKAHIEFNHIIEENFVDFLKQYLFRLIIGANDHCNRNFVTDGTKIFSIDDHCKNQDFKDLFNIKVKQKIKETWKKWISVFKSDILKFLEEWNKKNENISYQKRCSKLILIINEY